MAKIKLPELSLKGFFYVPSAGVYLAKERSLNGLSWENTVKEIYKKGVKIEKQRAEMPTPFEFMSGVIYALDNKNTPNLTEDERQEFLDDILKTGDYRGNHLNMRFSSSEIETARLENGKLKWERKPLEECLEADCFADIRKINSQGLFTDKSQQQNYVFGQNAYFLRPEKGSVARFVAGSLWAFLYCCRGSQDSNPSLGVRFVVRPKGERLKNPQAERVEVYTSEQIKGALKRAKLQGIESILLDALKE